MANFSAHEGFLYNLSAFLDKLLSWKTLIRFSIPALTFIGMIFFFHLVKKSYGISGTTFFVLVLICGSVISFLLMSAIGRWRIRVDRLAQRQIEVDAREQTREQIQETSTQTEAKVQAREQAQEQIQEILAQIQTQIQAREQAQARVRELLAQAQGRLQELKQTRMQAQIRLQVLRTLIRVLRQIEMPPQAQAHVQAQPQEGKQIERQELKPVQQEVLEQVRELARGAELLPQEQEWARELERELVKQMDAY
jgi:small-conductance mechanosensitive channel